MLPFAVGQYVLLLSDPLLGGFHATGAAAFAFTTLADVFGVRIVGRSATIPANIHGTDPACEHPNDDQFGPFGTTLPCLASNWPQSSSIRKRSFAGLGIYIHGIITS